VSPRKPPLDAFAIKAHQHGRLAGVGMGVHAIPDSFAILHGGVGCKYKTIGDLYVHDSRKPSHNIQAYTEITDADLVQGSGGRIGPYLRSWFRRRQPGFMVVPTATFAEMTGEDFGSAVREAARTVACETAYIPCLGFDGDLYDGYADLVMEVVRRVPFHSVPRDPRRVSLLGYCFDRHEPDHEGNLAELRRLMRAVGLKPGPVLLDGSRFQDLLPAARSGVLASLPYLRGRERELRAASGRDVRALHLPIGIESTRRWLELLGAAAKLPKAKTAAAARKLARAAAKGLDPVRKKLPALLPGIGCAVFADTPMAAGLAGLLMELGLKPRLIGLTDRSLGGRAAFLKDLRLSGKNLPRNCTLLEAPTLRSVQAELSTALARCRLGAVIGTSIELDICTRMAHSAPPAFVELGYPSTTYHPSKPAPFLGFAGALHLSRRLIQARG